MKNIERYIAKHVLVVVNGERGTILSPEPFVILPGIKGVRVSFSDLDGNETIRNIALTDITLPI